VRLDAIAPAEPDEVGLQVLPVEPPQRPWMVPPRREAGQVDWRDGVRHAAIFPPPHHARRDRRDRPGDREYPPQPGTGPEGARARRVDTVDGHDAVVPGGAVYAGHWLKPARELVARYRLSSIESVSLL
jgi:hypothetical protein